MADEKALEQRLDLTNSVKSSILDAIKKNLAAEKVKSVDDIGKMSSAIANLAARDLYSKNTPGDGYSKNTQREAFGSDVIRTLEELRVNPNEALQM